MPIWYTVRHWLGRLAPTEPSGLPWGLTVEAILATMPGYLAVVDMQWRILMVNPAFVESLGYHHRDVIAHSISEVVSAEELPFGGTLWERLVREGAVLDVEATYRSKSGEGIPVSFHARVIRDRLRRPVGAVTVAMDMRRMRGLIQTLRTFSSDLQQKAEALETSQRQLQEKMAEMERFHRLVVDREARMIELKQELQQLRQQGGR